MVGSIVTRTLLSGMNHIPMTMTATNNNKSKQQQQTTISYISSNSVNNCLITNVDSTDVELDYDMTRRGRRWRRVESIIEINLL